MIYRKSILGFNAVAALVMIVASATTLPIGSTVLDAQAQNSDTSQQIRDYLIQAIQAIDSGDKTEAIQQLQLASNQMGTDLTGVAVQSNDVEGKASGDSGESDDRGEASEEEPGEDADEPGDRDENDEDD
jgi:hypothetical protein